MANDHKDYSGTPLWRKLGIAPESRVYMTGTLPGLASTLTAISPLPPGVTFLTRPGRDLDVIVIATTREAELRRRFARLMSSLAPAGRLWVAWPKKASAIGTDLTFEVVQAIGLGAGLVDNKSASITTDHQGLQFVVRRADRPR